MTEFQVSFPGLGIFDLPIRRELINIFGFSIYWYGVVAAIALAIVMTLVLRRSKKFGFSQDDMNDYFLFLIPGSIVGARLYYVAFSFASFRDNLLTIFDIRSGGLAFYGGVIGGCLTLYFVCLHKKQNFIALLGFLAPYLALGQGIGRIANFFNQEAFGTNTTLPWGMISNGTKAYLASLHLPNLDPNLPVHPTFLYEFLGNLLIFGALIAMQNYLYKSSEENDTSSLGTKESGLIMALYCLLYGALRFFVEGIRTDALYVGASNLRVSQLLSLLMVVVGLLYTLYFLYKQQKEMQ